MHTKNRPKVASLMDYTHSDLDKLLKPEPLHSGFRELDAVTGGFLPGELICIAARRSVGSTGLALSILNRVCIQKKKKCLYFALSDGKRNIIRRLISNHAGDVSVWDPGNDAAFGESLKAVSRSPLFINETAFSTRTIARVCGDLKRKSSPDLVVIDYFSLVMEGKDDASYVSVFLKKLSRTLNCPVIVLCQLGSDIDNRKDPRPLLSDLNEIGQMNHYADKVLFLYRPDYYRPQTEQKSLAKIFIAKNTFFRSLGAVNLLQRNGGIFESLPKDIREERHG